MLPYATHLANLNVSNSLYTFKNIRYADPPIGALRFKNPQNVSTVNTTIQDGSYGPICFQLEQGQNGQLANQNEDCLFLDIVVPANLTAGTKLPVMYYMYGGGFHSGLKDIYDGSPLVTASGNDMIYVAANYRTGAFGWLGEYGDPTPGLYDTIQAMNWIQEYIHLFGGDPNQVTAAGHSAGGGMMMTHLISNGGSGTLPFQKAVVMSPAVVHVPEAAALVRNAGIYSYFGYTGYTTEQMQALSGSAINDMTAHYGAAGWGPIIIEGSYYAEMPGAAMAAGRYHKDIPVLAGKLSDEAHNYIPTVSPYIINGTGDIRDVSYDTIAQMRIFFDSIGFNFTDSVLDEIWELYPMINNTDIYYTIFGKYDKIMSDLEFNCNTYYLATAYSTVYEW